MTFGFVRMEFDARKPRMDLLSFFVLLLLNAVVRDVASSWSLNAAIASLILFWVASNEWALENIRPRKPPPKPPDKIRSRRIRSLALVGLWMLFRPCNFWFEDDSTSSNRSVTSSQGRIVDIFERDKLWSANEATSQSRPESNTLRSLSSPNESVLGSEGVVEHSIASIC